MSAVETTWRRSMCAIAFTALAAQGQLAAQQAVSFQTSDGWTIHAAEWGQGDTAVVLLHGGRFTKESWRPQAEQLAKAGLRVLAIDLRGYGASKGASSSADPGYGSPLDALAAVRYLRASGARTVSLIGASMGADVGAGASIGAEPGEIDALVMIAGSASDPPEQLKGRKLFVVAREDANAAGPRLPRIRVQFERARHPKQLLVLDGAAHAQFLFETAEGAGLMREIVRFVQLGAHIRPRGRDDAPGSRPHVTRTPGR